MNGSNKILTVSYGTFSCTLEGFEDPFNSMRSIAEYFRDLAADDRYFGAEPPTPDVEMLQALAERESRSRVAARLSDNGNGVALTVENGAAPAGEDTAPLTTPDDFTADEPEDALVLGEDVPAPDGPAETIAEKLSRIRAVVSRQQHPVSAEEFAETDNAPEPPRSRALTRTLSDIAADIAGEDFAEEADDVVSADAGSDEGEDEDWSVMDEAPAEDEASREDTTESDWDEPLLAEATEAVLSEVEATSEEDADELPAEAPEEVAAADEGESDAGDEAEPIVAEEAVEETQEAAEAVTGEAEPTAEDAEHPTDEEADTDEDDGEDDGRDDIRAKAAMFAEPIEMAPEAQETEAEPEMTEAAPEMTEAAPEDSAADVAPEESPAEAPSESVAETEEYVAPEEMTSGFDPEPNAFFAPDTEEHVEDDASEEMPAASDAEEPFEDERTNLDRVISVLSQADDAETEEEAEPQAQTRRESRVLDPVDDGEEGVGRLMSETEGKLADDDSVRRRRVISQMRAAVAATRADRILSRLSSKSPGRTETTDEPYRRDLDRVVTAGRDKSPLMLVSELRVDDDEDEDDGDDIDLDIETAARQTEGNDEGFARFASDMNARALPELLEAAAAYSAFVEGEPHFSRPDLMRRVAGHATDMHLSREQGLRSFGQLLREGKIRKLQRGQFTVDESTRYNPAHRIAGE